jgi:predicted component of type VI protein secretion system
VKLQLVLLEGDHKGHRLTVEIGLVIVGRAKGSAIRIPSERISRRHCRIWLEAHQVWVEDLGSENGTFVNEDPAIGRVQLNPGDELKVAHVRFRVQYQPEASSEVESRPEPVPQTPYLDPADVPTKEDELVPLEPNAPDGAFDLPFTDEDEEPVEAGESMNLPTQDPYDFKNILRELDDPGEGKKKKKRREDD